MGFDFIISLITAYLFFFIFMTARFEALRIVTNIIKVCMKIFIDQMF